MRVSLIQPTVNTYFDKAGIRGITEPLGLCYLAATLENQGHSTQIIHQLEESNDQVITKIKEFQPDAIGITGTTHNFYSCGKLAKVFKKELGDIPIIYGGYHISGSVYESYWNQRLLQEVFSFPFDIGVFGEGEDSLSDIINCLNKGEEIRNISGTVLNKEGKIIINSTREPLKNLDSLPFPKREGLPYERYFQNVPIELPLSQQRFASVYSSRGCRYSCNFCQTSTMWGKWRTRSPKNIADEIELLQGTLGINYVWFPDEDFLADKERVKELCEEIEKRKLKFFWRSFFRATDVQTPQDEELLRLMYRFGYRAAFIGIETMNSKILESMKDIRTAQVEKAVDICSRVGISIRGTYMIGYHNESKEELEESISQILNLPLDELYITHLTPFPGTKLYRFCEENDLLTTTDFSKMDSNHPCIRSKISEEDLITIKRTFTLNFYLASVPRMLKKLELNPQLTRGYREFWEKVNQV